jgi:hypothetical protein
MNIHILRAEGEVSFYLEDLVSVVMEDLIEAALEDGRFTLDDVETERVDGDDVVVMARCRVVLRAADLVDERALIDSLADAISDAGWTHELCHVDKTFKHVRTDSDTGKLVYRVTAV